jgi:hypothetical protein
VTIKPRAESEPSEATPTPPPAPRLAPELRRFALLAGAIVASVVLVATYLLLGGGDYQPSRVADPCTPRDVPPTPTSADSPAAVAQRIVLVALARTACSLGTTREELALALVQPQGVNAILAKNGRTPAEVDRALAEGVRVAVADARKAGVLQPTLADFLTAAAAVVPINQLIGWATSNQPPCDPIAWGDTKADLGRVTARIALDGVARAACTLRLPVADVVVAASSKDTLGSLATAAHTDQPTVEAAIRNGVLAAVDAAATAGALDQNTAEVLRAVVAVVPVERVISTVRGDTSACEPLAWQKGGDATRVAAQIGVIASLKSACALGVPIEELLVDLADPRGVDALAASSGKSAAEVDPIVRDSVRQAIDEAVANGALTGTVGNALKTVVDVVPLDRLFATIRGEDISCLDPTWRPTSNTSQLAAEIALIGISDASCKLKVPVFDLAAALSSAQALDAYVQKQGLDRGQVENALRDGLNKGVHVAQDNGAIGTVTAFLLEQTIDNAPVLDVLQLIEGRL